MDLPFSPSQFFDVFVRYNTAVWPAQWLLWTMALAAVVLSFRGGPASSRIVSAVLALFWLWMGLVYHFEFFAAINPAARFFGAAFAVAAALFIWFGVWKGQLTFAPALDPAGGAGAVLMIYALVGYPLVGYLAGHRYPAIPTFGAPCPTTIFTLGILLWIRGRVPWPVLIVPVAWSLVGSSAAFSLGVPEDYGLLVAGLAAVAITRFRSRREAKPVFGDRGVVRRGLLNDGPGAGR